MIENTLIQRGVETAPGRQVPSKRPVRCLVTDANSFDRRLIRTTARDCATNLAVTEARSLIEARALVVSERPDVVIVADRLPDGDGIDFLRELAGRDGTGGTATILTSAGDAAALRDAASRAGVASVLTKRGLTAAALDRAVSAALAKAAARTAAMRHRRSVAAEPSAGTQDAGGHRDAALAQLAGLKGDVIRLLSQSWKLIDAGEGATDAARAQLSELTRAAIATIDDLTVDIAVGERAPAPAPLSLVALLREATLSLEDTLRARGARVTATALPEVRGVKAHFRMLFEQLLLHGLRFARLGLRPSIEFGGGRAPDESWTLWYRDEGINIATRVQADRRVLRQAGDTGATDAPAGFGLSVCQRLAERNGGGLSIFGEQDGGCRIVMRFPAPAADKEDPSGVGTPAADAASGTGPTTTPRAGADRHGTPPGAAATATGPPQFPAAGPAG